MRIRRFLRIINTIGAHGLDEFLHFMQRVGELSGGSFAMTPITVMTNDDYSCDVTNNQGVRVEDPSKKLNIDVAHVLRWKRPASGLNASTNIRFVRVACASAAWAAVSSGLLPGGPQRLRPASQSL